MISTAVAEVKRALVMSLLVAVAASLLAANLAPAIAVIHPFSTFTITVSTDRPVYAQGSQVTITGTLTRSGSPVPSTMLSAEVTKPSSTLLFVDMPNTNGAGQFSTAFTLLQSTDLGQYSVRIAYQDASAQTTFLVVQVTTTTTTATNTSSKLSITTTTSSSSLSTSSMLSTSTVTSTTSSVPEFGDWTIVVLSFVLVVTVGQTHRHRGSSKRPPT